MIPVYIRPEQVPQSCAIWDNLLYFQLKNGTIECYDLESCIQGDPFLPVKTKTQTEYLKVPSKFLKRLDSRLSFKIEKVTQTFVEPTLKEEKSQENSVYSVSWSWGGVSLE
jgi:hypothetical protein